MNDSIEEKGYNYLLKFVVIGDAAVGKSNLSLRFTHGQFKSEYQLTIGVEFNSSEIAIDNEIYRIHIWDTAGQENFRAITRSYYKNSTCALLVYEIDSRASFENITEWITDCKNSAPKQVLMVLVGNKCDLEDKGQRQVTEEEGREFAEKNGMLFFETSAKTGKNVEEVFKQATANIALNIKEGLYDLKSDKCGIKIIKNENSFVVESSLEKENKGSGCKCC